MTLSMATDYSIDVHAIRSRDDYANGVGNPEIYLRRIAEAGFSYVHWCHHWRSDFFYQEPELVQIERWLKKYNLQVLDVHGSEGLEKFWYSPQEYARLAGVELVKNRLDFAARFGGDAVVMHVYPLPEEPLANEYMWNQLRKSLDALTPYCRHLGVKLAIENLYDGPALKFDKTPVAELRDNRQVIERIFAAYPPDVVGLCWDTGHGHIGYDRTEVLAQHKERLIVTHLHDNDGQGDDHRLIFAGTIDWPRAARLIAESPYNKPLTLEVVLQEAFASEEEFLAKANETGQRFAAMVADG